MNTDWEHQLILGRFRVDVRLPGPGESYRAWDNQTKQIVSLHLLLESADDVRRVYETGFRELERVAHPGILPYLGLFELSGQRFWVEAHLEGPTLQLVLDAAQGTPLPLGEALTYIKSLSAALDALHELGLSHGSLRAESVRLGRDGRIYLSGLFAAQRLADDLAKATDVAALAKLLYEMLAGVLPNQRPWPDLRTLNPDVPEFLARTLPRALGENAESRIASPTEFFLMACLACHIEAGKLPDRIGSGADSPSMGIVTGWVYLSPMPPPPVAAKAIEPRDRNREPSPLSWWLMAGAVVGVGLMVGFFFSGQSQAPARPLPTAGVASTAGVVPDVSPEPTIESLAPFPTDTVVPTVNAPDGLGGRIVFTCTRSELMQLCMVKPNGEGGVVRLTGERAHDFYPVLSPNGKSVLFASNRNGSNTYDLYLKVFEGDTLTQLTNSIGDVSSASFAPDGKTIVFSNMVNGKPSLWTMDGNGENAVLVYEGEGGHIASPVWSPNGKNIAFVMSTVDTPESYEAFIYDTETQTVAPVTKGHLSHAGGSVDWSPDGRFLLFFAGPGSDNDIYQLELISGEIVKLTNGGNNFAPSYSPDGQWIVFNILPPEEDASANIFIMRPDGSDVRQVTNDAEPDWQPRWGR